MLMILYSSMQVAASALLDGGEVVWVGQYLIWIKHKPVLFHISRLTLDLDTASSMPGPRFRDILNGFPALEEGKPSSCRTPRISDELLQNFTHMNAPSLAHLISLISHPSPNFPPQKATLIVVDSVSIPFAQAFSNTSRHRDLDAKQNDQIHWARNRRWGVLRDFISGVGKLAITRDVAILLTTQTISRVKSESGAALLPAVSGTAWDAGIDSRIVLFRDWLPPEDDRLNPDSSKWHSLRFAGVLKAGGALLSPEGVFGQTTAFVIDLTGLQQVELESSQVPITELPILANPLKKRKAIEIADSEGEEDELGSDEEYGWGENDGMGEENLENSIKGVDDAFEEQKAA